MQNNKAYQLYHSLSYHSCMINSWNSIWNINCKCTAHRISLSLTPFQVICKIIIIWIWRFLKIQILTFAVDTKLMSWWAYFKLYICYNFLLKYSACFSRILLLNNFSFLGLCLYFLAQKRELFYNTNLLLKAVFCNILKNFTSIELYM